MLPQILERVRRNRELRKALAAAERDLVRAERLAAIGEMTVTLHHEINNPLDVGLRRRRAAAGGPRMPPDRAPARPARRSRRPCDRIRDIVRQIGDLREVRTQDLPARDPDGSISDRRRALHPARHRGPALLVHVDEDLAASCRCSSAAPASQVRARRRPSADAAVGRARDIGVSLVVLGGRGAAGAHPLGGFTAAGRSGLSGGRPGGEERAGAAPVRPARITWCFSFLSIPGTFYGGDDPAGSERGAGR